MRTVNVHDAKTHLSRLLEEVSKGETVVIARAGRPVAQLVPLPSIDIVFGGLAGRLRYDDHEFAAADAEVAQMFSGLSGADESDSADG